MPRLPAANEFSPGQLGGPTALIELLEGIHDRAGDRAQVVEWIRRRWFTDAAKTLAADPAGRLKQQVKRSENVVSGMRQYGLLTGSKHPLVFTDLANELFGMRQDAEQTFTRFAEHLLRDKEGLGLLEAAEAVVSRKGSASRADIRQELIARGYVVPTNSTYDSKLRQWLEAAHLVTDKWVVDQNALSALLGIGSSDVARWRGLSPAQRAVVEILRVRSLGNQTPISSKELLDLLRQRGVSFNEAQVRKQIYAPLEAAGLIELPVKGGGRGGKGGVLALTQYGAELDVTLIDNLQLGTVPPELQAHLSRQTNSILTDLESPDTGVKGVALELLSLRLAADLGLMPADMRLRSVDTGGAEVDLVAEGAHLHFSRWLFQCKATTASVGLSVLAKEIGMATLLKAQVVVIVTTSTFARTVLDYARQAAESTSIQVILLDKASLKNYRTKGPAALRDELHQAAVAVLATKRAQLEQVPRESH